MLVDGVLIHGLVEVTVSFLSEQVEAITISWPLQSHKNMTIKEIP